MTFDSAASGSWENSPAWFVCGGCQAARKKFRHKTTRKAAKSCPSRENDVACPTRNNERFLRAANGLSAGYGAVGVSTRRRPFAQAARMANLYRAAALNWIESCLPDVFIQAPTN